MATLIPSLNSCLPKMTAGEKRFARRLESHLEDDYSCWYDIPVGDRQRYSDFIVLHPRRGLLLLEVKDWKIDTIRKASKTSIELITQRGLKTLSHPLEQVRQCTYALVNKMEKDQILVRQVGEHRGKLLFPYGFGVVLSNITRTQFDKAGLAEIMPSHRVICADEFVESIDSEVLQQRLWDMFDVTFGSPLSLPVIDRIRWHIFPEIRIEDAIQCQPQLTTNVDGVTQELEEVIPDLVKVMDFQQEKLARSLGRGHRVIHGVAGSGKTMVLGYRCLHLARLLKKPILVTCFNITLASRLRALMASKGLSEKVHVHHFHSWCGEQIRAYNLDRPKSGPGYVKALVQTVIKGVDGGMVPRGQYGALLIDEGHDFEQDWLKMIVQMVHPDEGSLLLLYDDAQSIYQNKKAMDFSLSSVGIQARGRTTILKTNYRNTDEILDFSYRFVSKYLSPKGCDEDHIPIIEPTGAGRSGPKPHFHMLDSKDGEMDYVARAILKMHKTLGHSWRDILIACRSKSDVADWTDFLKSREIPVTSLKEQSAKANLNLGDDTVKVMTLHSSKGLEFPVVIIPGVGQMPANSRDEAGEARLLYVGMTRSTDKLIVTSSGKSKFSALLAA